MIFVPDEYAAKFNGAGILVEIAYVDVFTPIKDDTSKNSINTAKNFFMIPLLFYNSPYKKIMSNYSIVFYIRQI